MNTIKGEVDIKTNVSSSKSFSDSLNKKKKGTIEKGIEARNINKDIGPSLVAQDLLSVENYLPYFGAAVLGILSYISGDLPEQNENDNDMTEEDGQEIFDEFNDTADNLTGDVNLGITEDGDPLIDINEITEGLIGMSNGINENLLTSSNELNFLLQNYEDHVNPEGILENTDLNVDQKINYTGDKPEIGADKISGTDLSGATNTYNESLKTALNTEKSLIEDVTRPAYDKLRTTIISVMEAISGIYNVDLDENVEKAKKEADYEWGEEHKVPVFDEVDYSNMGGTQTTPTIIGYQNPAVNPETGEYDQPEPLVIPFVNVPQEGGG